MLPLPALQSQKEAILYITTLIQKMFMASIGALNYMVLTGQHFAVKHDLLATSQVTEKMPRGI